MKGKSVKANDLEVVLTALAEHVRKVESYRNADRLEAISAQSKSMGMLLAIININDVLNDKELSKREKIHDITAIVDGALNPDIGVNDDWGYE